MDFSPREYTRLWWPGLNPGMVFVTLKVYINQPQHYFQTDCCGCYFFQIKRHREKLQFYWTFYLFLRVKQENKVQLDLLVLQESRWDLQNTCTRIQTLNQVTMAWRFWLKKIKYFSYNEELTLKNACQCTPRHEVGYGMYTIHFILLAC